MIEKIEAIICAGEGIDPEDLHTPRRKGEFNITRQMIMWFAKNETTMSLSEIANYFGRTNHATALSNIGRINNLIDTEPSFLAKINSYQNKINNQRQIFAKIDATKNLIGNLHRDMELIKCRYDELTQALQTLNSEIVEANS